MRLFILVLCFAFGQAFLFTKRPYSYAPRCKINTEPCIKLRCSWFSSVGYYPFTILYGCCNGYVFDQKNYICVRFRSSSTPRVLRCNPCTQFRCGNGQCILKQWRCNGMKDCKDGSDEKSCWPCKSNQFRCANKKKCILGSQVCDKINNCGDGSDETGCPRKDGSSCGDSSYRCRNDRCISKSLVCNGVNNCKDNSDEHLCSKKSGREEIPLKDETIEQSDSEEITVNDEGLEENHSEETVGNDEAIEENDATKPPPKEGEEGTFSG